MKVAVVVADLNGSLPEGQKFASGIGRMLLTATLKATGAGVESVTPFSSQGVTAILVKADLTDRERVANLVFHGGEQLKAGAGDELVFQRCQVEALGLEHLMGLAGRTGVSLSCSNRPAAYVLAIKAA